MRIQVIFGEHRESDFTCGRCGGSGTELPGMPDSGPCLMGCNKGKNYRGRAYTYDAPDAAVPPLWSMVIVPGSAYHPWDRKATVVAHGSDYTGECKSIISTVVDGREVQVALMPPAPANLRPARKHLSECPVLDGSTDLECICVGQPAPDWTIG